MAGLPTYAWFFIFAVIAAAAARVLVGRVRDDAASFPGWILYAVAIACVVLGIAMFWLGRAG